MARPRIPLPPAEAIRALADTEGRLALRVTPNAGADGLAIENGELRARVTATPEDGKANSAVIKIVARALKIAPSRIELLRGATSREKLLRIAD